MCRRPAELSLENAFVYCAFYSCNSEFYNSIIDDLGDCCLILPSDNKCISFDAASY